MKTQANNVVLFGNELLWTNSRLQKLHQDTKIKIYLRESRKYHASALVDADKDDLKNY